MVNEECPWVYETKKNNLRILLRSVIQGVLASIRMKNLIKNQGIQTDDPSKKSQSQSQPQSLLQQLKDQKPTHPPPPPSDTKPSDTEDSEGKRSRTRNEHPELTINNSSSN